MSASAQEQPLLEHIREHSIEQSLRHPAYTCLETIDRRHETLSGELKVEDTIRVEVAIVDGKEMYSWPGSPEFESAEATELVRRGTFASGNFGLYPRLVFYGNGGQFTPQGEQQDGKTRFDFVVPREASGFHLQTKAGDAVLGFQGYLIANPKTLDLAVLEITANDLSAVPGVRHATDHVEYERIKIDGGDFLLPVRAISRVGGDNGANENHVEFSKCRKFTGESRVLDIEPEDAATTRTVQPRQVELPATIEPIVTLPSIDLKSAAVGDSITALVRSDVKSGKQTIVPKGAMARGRIIRLDRYPAQVELRIKVEELEWSGAIAQLPSPLIGEMTSIGKNVRKMGSGTITLKTPAR